MVGCSDSAPECSDSDVKDLVLNISKKELKKQVSIEKHCQEYKRRAENFANSSDKVKSNTMYKDDNKFVRQQVAKCEQSFNELDKIDLTAIRTASIDEETKKSTCKAQLQFRNGYTKDISYTAQMTSEEKLFVELYGLQ